MLRCRYYYVHFIGFICNKFLAVDSVKEFNVHPMFVAYWLKKTRIRSNFKSHSRVIDFACFADVGNA